MAYSLTECLKIRAAKKNPKVRECIRPFLWHPASCSVGPPLSCSCYGDQLCSAVTWPHPTLAAPFNTCFRFCDISTSFSQDTQRNTPAHSAIHLKMEWEKSPQPLPMANLVSTWINSPIICPAGHFGVVFIVNFLRVSPMRGNPRETRGNWLDDAAYF